ncbi:MAG: MDR family MFS transporter [Longimicrobiales bacterium]
MNRAPTNEPNPRIAHKWKVLISVVFGTFMVILDTTVVNVAFQTLRHEFDAPIADAQWIISLYVLVLGIATPLAGFLADRFGIKRAYLSGLALFTFGSVLCGLAPSLAWLVTARAIQGLGGGFCVPLGSAQLLRTFPAREQGRALGVFGIVIVLAPAMGPVVGGALVDLGLWRWIFFVNVPIGILGITLGSRFLREFASPHTIHMDWLGLVTEMIGFGAILFAASIAEVEGWTSPRTQLWLMTGLLGLAAFAFVELRIAKHPLLDLRLFRRRTFLIASLVGYASIIALFGAEFLMPLYLQMLRGTSALEAGLILLPMAMAAGIASPTAGRIYDHTGPRPLLVIGFILLSINTWQFSLLDANTPIPWVMTLLAIRGAALGLTVQTTFVAALSVVAGPALARGTSLVNATRNVVQSLGVALLATVLASTLSPQTRRIQLDVLSPVEADSSITGLCRPTGLAGPLFDAARQTACAESVRGFELAYRLTFVAALLALFLATMLPGWPAPWGGRTSHHPD